MIKWQKLVSELIYFYDKKKASRTRDVLPVDLWDNFKKNHETINRFC